MTVNIYAAADIHGRPARLKLLSRMLEETAADVFVAAGDILGRRAKPEALAALAQLPVPVVAVAGNSDSRSVMQRLEHIPRIHCLHLQTFSIDGIDFVGVGGTVPLPFRSRLALREQSLVAKAAALVGANTVLVAHPPPHGVRDLAFNRVHVGSRRLRQLVLTRRPRVLICGHVHEQAGGAILGVTLVVNCSMGRGGAGALITLEADGPPRVEML